MNDLHHPCEPWAERISLAAAGCLSPDEDRETRRHIEKCSDCRERFRQLTELCGVLAEARAPAESSETAIVGRVMSAITTFDVRAEILHPTLLTRSLDHWRWMMRSPVSRVAAAVIFVLSVTGVALLFHGGGVTPALADFVKPILEAKTAKYKIITEIKGPPATTITGEVMMMDANRSRQEMESPNMPKGVMIFDWGQGKSLTLDPKTKKAMVVTVSNLTKEQILKQDMFAQFRSILLDAQDKPDVKRESLGDKEIDGRRVVGFRVNTNGSVLSVWGDPKTGMPVRAEMTMAMYPGVKTTMTDFEFNVDLDESLFSVEPPPGYTVESQKVDVSPAEEKSLIETFRVYCDLSGGAFPQSLDMQSIMMKVGMMIGKKCAIQGIHEKLASGSKKLSEEQIRKVEELMDNILEWQLNPEKKPSEDEMRKYEEEMRKTAGLEEIMQELAGGKGKMSEEEVHKHAQAAAKKNAEAGMKEFMKIQVPLQRGLIFVFTLPPEADAHYAGKGLSIGRAETPVFWYRPKDAKKYRVIYADLSVREVDTAPNVHDAQPVPAQPSPKK